MLKLKLQYFGHLMRRADSLKKTLMPGKIEGRRRRGRQRMICWMASQTWSTWVWASSKSWWWTGRSNVLQSMGSQRVRSDWATELTENSHCPCYTGASQTCGGCDSVTKSQPTLVTLWTVFYQAPLDFPGKNTEVCCHFLLQGIFLMTQGSNPSLLHCRDSLLTKLPGEPFSIT